MPRIYTRRRRRSGSGGGAAFVSIVDTFTRADNAATMGSTEGANPRVWSALVGGWGISGNMAALQTTAADSVAVVDAGVSDCTVSITIKTTVSGQGVAFRCVDASNGWRTAYFSGSLYLQKKVTGTYTDVPGSPIVLAPADGDVIAVVLSGTSIIVKVNGVQKYSITDAQFQTATKHGLAQTGSGDSTFKYDTLSITVP